MLERLTGALPAVVLLLAALLTGSGCATQPTPRPVEHDAAEDGAFKDAVQEKPVISTPSPKELSKPVATTNTDQSLSKAPAAKTPGVTTPLSKRPALRVFSTATRSGRLQHPELTEVSGLAGSMNEAGVLFAVNDSGNSATLYALTDAGAHIAHWRLDIRNRDWEDLSRVRLDGKNYLIVGDTGDNLKVHRRSSLHFFEEPDLDNPLPSTLAPAHTVTFTYNDGPRNVEAFSVHDNTVYLITKEPVTAQGAQASRIYTLPLALSAVSGPLVAQYAGDLSFTRPNLEARLAASLAGVDLNHPTALEFDASGRQAYVLTYRHVLRFNRSRGQSWPAAFAQAGTRIHSHALEQAEALAVDNGRAIFITSEHASAPLWALPVNAPL